LNPKISIGLIYKQAFEIHKNYFKIGFPEKIYETIMSIQAAYFLSHEIRKKTDLFLFFLKNNTVIHFIGHRLRYLGPDERSIGMLLMKALEKLALLRRKGRIESTPGIWIERLNLFDFLTSLQESTSLILVNHKSSNNLKGGLSPYIILLMPAEEEGIFDEPNTIPGIQQYLTIGVQDLPKKMRNYLTILRFYSIIDKF